MAQASVQDVHVDQLIDALDAAVESEDCESICQCVKSALVEMIESGEERLPDYLLQPTDGSYARRLVHRDPQNRYSVVVMVWGIGQGTALHDHAGHWCVEAVYRGRIRVTSYDIDHETDEGLFHFNKQNEITAGVASAGSLIPPYEYHVLENDSPTNPAVTIHVYSEELTWSNAFFEEENGAFRKERRELSYTE